MRVAAAIVMTLMLLAGTYYYTAFADSVRREPVLFAAIMDEGRWRIEISRTFDCVPDPDSLLVRLHGEVLFRSESPLPRSEALIIADPAGIEVGVNEVYVEANAAAIDDFEFSADETPHALRIQIYRGDVPIADQTFWLASGATSIRETLHFRTSIAEPPNDSGHHQEHARSVSQ